MLHSFADERKRPSKTQSRVTVMKSVKGFASSSGGSRCADLNTVEVKELVLEQNESNNGIQDERLSSNYFSDRGKKNSDKILSLPS